MGDYRRGPGAPSQHGVSVPDPLFREHPKRLDIPLLAAVALTLLGWGVTLPALTFDNLWLFGDESFSVLTGIQSFFEHGNVLLGVLLASFSVIFPAAKLLTVGVLWFVSLRAEQRRETIEWLELLGKWSLLDAFVIAVLVGTVQFGILSDAVAEPGIYVYLAAIVLSLLVTFSLRPLVGRDPDPPARLSRFGLLFTVPSAVLYGVGLSLPLMYVEKGWFWENEFSVLRGSRRLMDQGEFGLGLAVAVFVIALPTVRFLGMIALRLAKRSGGAWIRWLRLIDKWSMADVFALAALVVITKIGAIASVEPRAGMWCLFAAGVLNGVDSILLHCGS